MFPIVKKSFSISTILLLLVSITGVSVNTHYCHGQARYTVIATDAEHESCCGDAMNACPSCEDRVQSNVMDEQSVVAASSHIAYDALSAVVVTVHMEMNDGDITVTPLQPFSHGPPGIPAGMTIPVFVQSFLN